jgi:tetratricopeptide (TPR) repeat protein
MAGETLEELLRRGEALRWQRRYAEASSTFAEAVARAEAEGNDALLADALVWQSIVLTLAQPSSEALSEALELQERAHALELAKYGPDHVRLADTLRVLGGTLASMGRRTEAIDSLQRSAEIFRRAKNQSLSAEDTLSRLASLLAEEGAHETCVDVANELVAVCEHLGDPMRLTVAHFLLGRCLVLAGRTEEAIGHLERVLDLAQPRIARGSARRLVEEVNEWLARARACQG